MKITNTPNLEVARSQNFDTQVPQKATEKNAIATSKIAKSVLNDVNNTDAAFELTFFNKSF